jgi:hypothetical protein
VRVTLVNHHQVDIDQSTDRVWADILDTYLTGSKFKASGYEVTPLKDDLSAPQGGYRIMLRNDQGEPVDERITRVTEIDHAARRLSLSADYLLPAETALVVYASYQALPIATGARYHLDCHSSMTLAVGPDDDAASVAAKMAESHTQAGAYVDASLKAIKARLEAL